MNILVVSFILKQLLGILESSSYSSSKATEKHDLSRRKKALEELNEAYECFDWNHVYQGQSSIRFWENFTAFLLYDWLFLHYQF
jgi:hypothetical protein